MAKDSKKIEGAQLVVQVVHVGAAMIIFVDAYVCFFLLYFSGPSCCCVECPFGQLILQLFVNEIV